MKYLKASLFAWVLLLALLLGQTAGAQTIVTAEQFFQKVAERYGAVKEYEASIRIISSGTQPMDGVLIFKAPALLRIDFSQPADQVIVFDGKTLIVYLPQYRAILQQDTELQAGSLGAAALASKEGLSLLKRNYIIAWERSPAPEPLDPGSDEMVYRLMLTRKNVAEGYKNIRLSVGEKDSLIRRLEGWTTANEKITFDFRDIRINQGISEARFKFDPPASTNLYSNFLFQ